MKKKNIPREAIGLLHEWTLGLELAGWKNVEMNVKKKDEKLKKS